MFRTSNDSPTSILYINNRLYLKRLSPYMSHYPNLINFNIGEKFLYGRVDRHYVPIKTYTPVYFAPFADAPALSRSQPVKEAFNFVVKAFSDMQAQFKKCAARGQISGNEKYLSNLKVYRAYENPAELYYKYAASFDEVLVKKLRAPHIKILKFEDFAREVKVLLYKGARTYPYTQAGFIKSSIAPILISGLALEISDLKYENDEAKLKHFIDTPNWEFYLQTCNNYGFMVDCNIPWRLIADLDSPIMRLYAARFRQKTSATQVLTTFYRPVAQPSFLNFRHRMFELYKKAKKEGFTEAQYCDGRYINKMIKPRVYDPASFFEQFDTDYFLKMYMEMRFAENEVPCSQTERDNLIHMLNEQSKLKGIYYSLVLLERFLGKPFDYSGSMNYYRNKLEAMTKHKLEEEGSKSPLGATRPRPLQELEPAQTSSTPGGGY